VPTVAGITEASLPVVVPAATMPTEVHIAWWLSNILQHWHSPSTCTRRMKC
jgi:hypothetical protein